MCSRKIVLTVAMAMLLFSCKKDKIEYEVMPVIEFISISPDPVKEFQPLTIIFKYTDGDGDLGENDPTIKNLFITDNRVAVTYEYRINQLSPDNTNIPIQGKLETIIDNAVINGTAVEQTVTYSIYIVDRAGHKSNEITTSSIVIKQ